MTIFRGFFRFMNSYDGNPHGARIAQQNKASYNDFEVGNCYFSTSLSTDVERKLVVLIKSISLAALGAPSGSAPLDPCEG